MLHKQQAAGPQDMPGGFHHGTGMLQPGGAGDQGRLGLIIAYAGVQGGVLRLADVRRIADYQMQPRVARIPEAGPGKIRADEGQAIGRVQPLGVASGRFQGMFRNIHGHAFPERPFRRQSDRQTTAARTQIGEMYGAFGQTGQSLVHQMLGFGAGDEGGGVDLKRASVKFAPPQQIGQRLAGQTTSKQLSQALFGFGRHFTVRMGNEGNASRIQHRAQQQFRRAARRLGPAQGAARLFKPPPPGHRRASPVRSRRASSSGSLSKGSQTMPMPRMSRILASATSGV